MKSEQLNITQVTPLVNGFYELVFHAPHHAIAALPGHFVYIAEKYPYYLLGQQGEAISLIVKQHAELNFNNITSLSISTLQGYPLPMPSEDHFNLIQSNEDALNAVIFYLKKFKYQFQGLVLIGAKQFPFKPCPSRLLIPGIPSHVIAAVPLLEDWQIPNRLANDSELPGCFQGSVEELAKCWLNNTKVAKPLKTLYIAAPK